MRSKSKGAFFAVAAMSFLGLGCLLSVLIPGTPLLWVIAGFVSFVACGRRAIILWRLDERVFDHPDRHLRAPRPPAGTIAPVLLLSALASLTLSHSVLLDRG